MNASDQPLVSVVMPCYNAAAFVAETLAGVLSQSGPALEVVVVDDGSTDDSAARIAAVGDPRVRLTSTPPSGGPSRPRNLGLAQARGRYLFFFDADDIMYPGKVATQVAAMERDPSLALTFTNFRVLNSDGTVADPDFLAGYATFAALRRLAPDGVRLPREACYLALLRANFIGTSGVAVRRDVIERVGGFDESLASGEDIDLWLRIAR